MASLDGSKTDIDRCPWFGSNTVGLPTRGSRCRDDACIPGTFYCTSLSTVYRSNRNGEAGAETGASASGIATAIASGTATDAATCLASGVADSDSTPAYGIRPRCRGEQHRTA